MTRNVLASPIAAGSLALISARRGQSEREADREGHHEADDELGEALPDFRRRAPCPWVGLM